MKQRGIMMFAIIDKYVVAKFVGGFIDETFNPQEHNKRLDALYKRGYNIATKTFKDPEGFFNKNYQFSTGMGGFDGSPSEELSKAMFREAERQYRKIIKKPFYDSLFLDTEVLQEFCLGYVARCDELLKDYDY